MKSHPKKYNFILNVCIPIIEWWMVSHVWFTLSITSFKINTKKSLDETPVLLCELKYLAKKAYLGYLANEEEDGAGFNSFCFLESQKYVTFLE